LNSKLHAVTDQYGKPLILLLTPGQVSDHKGAALMLAALPKAKSLTGDRGYDSDAFRNALMAKGIEPCIPPKKNRKVQHAYDEKLYKKRHKIENSFAWLKDWRRIAMRYDRCAHTFFSAICIAAAFIFYLR
jgi:putative transposase